MFALVLLLALVAKPIDVAAELVAVDSLSNPGSANWDHSISSRVVHTIVPLHHCSLAAGSLAADCWLH